jgi:hypothetical protein
MLKTIYTKSNLPQNVVKALTGRIEEIIHGYTTEDAKAALLNVMELVSSHEHKIAPEPEATFEATSDGSLKQLGLASGEAFDGPATEVEPVSGLVGAGEPSAQPEPVAA